jgi:hypothetical protein
MELRVVRCDVRENILARVSILVAAGCELRG